MYMYVYMYVCITCICMYHVQLTCRTCPQMVMPVSVDICDKKKTKSGRDEGGPVNAKN